MPWSIHLLVFCLLVCIWPEWFSGQLFPTARSTGGPGASYAHGVGAHMLICIYAQDQSKYISVISLILFLYLIHFIVRTLFQIFSEFFPIFVAVLFISKSLSFQHGTLICFCLGAHIPVHHAESNSIICIACAHLGTNFLACWMKSKQRASYEIISLDGVYVGSNTHLHFSPQWVDHHWGGESPY